MRRQRSMLSSCLTLTVAAVMALSMMMTLGACSGDEDNPSATDAPTTTATTATETTQPPTDAPTDTPTDVPTDTPTDEPTGDPTTVATPTPTAPTSGVEVPTPYFDLQLKQDGTAEDPQNNVTFTIDSGDIGMNKVHYNGQEYSVLSYYGQSKDDYIDVTYDNFSSVDDLKELIFGGITFELFFEVDDLPGSSVGVMSSGYGGGINMTLRGAQSQMNFNIGNDAGNGEYSGSGFSYTQPTSSSEGRAIDAGQVAHMLAMYDPDSNNLMLYYNGELVSSADLGTQAFRLGSSIYNHLGIGVNISYPSEALGAFTEYTVIRSRVYDTALTAEQVTAAYSECIALLTAN